VGALRSSVLGPVSLFPAPEYDDSLKQLSRAEVQAVLDKACDSETLARGTLGRVPHYIHYM